MVLVTQVDEILCSLRGAFTRRRAFDWFVIVAWTLMLRLDAAGVTSIVRCLGLAPSEYYNLLHFFHSSAFQVKDLCQRWMHLVTTQLPLVQCNGSPLYLADAIKVGKAGKRMPGVRLLHQESEDNSKPEYIMGHYWGAVAAAVEAGSQVFAVPLRLQVQDGLKRSPSEKASLVDKMQELVLELLASGSTLVADAYYTSHTLLRELCKHGINYIGRIRINTVAYEPPAPGSPSAGRGPGRPRKYGAKVLLRDLFRQSHLFTWAEVPMYGEVKAFHYHVCDLLWQGISARFVLTIYKDGKEMILISTNTSWSAEDIITAYALRFKIEVGFKALVHVLFGFCYHFWMQTWPKTKEGQKNFYLHRASPSFRQQVYRKLEAYERFVNIAAIGLGILQWLSIRSPDLIWEHFPLWLRTLPKQGYPTEHIVRLTLQDELHRIFLKTKGSTLLEKTLANRKTVPAQPHPMRLTA